LKIILHQQKKYADIIIPRGIHNNVAIQLITETIRTKLRERGLPPTDLEGINNPNLSSLPPNVIILPANNQIRGIHTIIRDKNTNRSDFIFCSNRLTRLLVEEALSHLPFVPHVVRTPVSCTYSGVKQDAILYAVSIIRAGEAMEDPVRACCKGIPILKILIQSNDEKEPRLFYCDNFPKDIATRNILLLDPMLATGATTMMALKILIDHGVKQENIMFLTLVAAPEGITTVSYAFPKVKIITSEIDEGLNENLYIRPGIGNFGDRYFGTD